jgi:hypothetical protein
MGRARGQEKDFESEALLGLWVDPLFLLLMIAKTAIIIASAVKTEHLQLVETHILVGRASCTR